MVTPEEREELLAAYALGTLGGPDAAAVRDLVRSDRDAADELASYHEIVDLIALSAPLRRVDPSLRARVLEAARRERPVARRRRDLHRLFPWAAVAAVLALFVAWGMNMQQEVDALRGDNAALTAVVESDAKRIETLLNLDRDTSSRALRLELESTTADLQLGLAVGTAPDVRWGALEATSAGHRARGHFLWSDEVGAGTVTILDLPDLPLGEVYEVWVRNSLQWVSAGVLEPDEDGGVQTVVVPDAQISPTRVAIAVSPDGGSDAIGSPVVLEGVLGP